MDDHGWDLGGIYHSHTRTRAYPSATDVKLAFYPDSVYLIVELSRADYWKQLLTSRFHFYHRVATSGTYVVLSNQL